MANQSANKLTRQLTNQLIDQSSPYLLQHAHNPVNWYPWSDEAFEKARSENKPVFLSVGYATCHWCHVMERESFEDTEAAAALNDAFICIKVDREERPDIDAVYMATCQMVTGSGGWPLSIVMTPDKQPFFAGTYIPKQTAFGRLGLIDLCRRISQLWRDDPQRVVESAQALTSHLSDTFLFESANGHPPAIQAVDQAVADISQRYDAQFGGFDNAPKFPMAHRLIFLLNAYERGKDQQIMKMVANTLSAMRMGGLWDHVGFGFHRYSTDRQWLLPHFEKMLYDQALLAMAYLKAFIVDKNPLFEQTARQIFSYVLRDMTDPAGGFYTAEDADSDGEEGKFYVWSRAAFENLLTQDQKSIPWTEIFNLTQSGNFIDEATREKTGTNILHLTSSWQQWADRLDVDMETLLQRWETLRTALFDARVRRTPPLKDDKILTDWNGLMIAALAKGAETLNDPRYLEAARKAADFILSRMRGDGGQLLHRYRQGRVAIAATANDYAFFTMGLVALYQADGQTRWKEQAVQLQQRLDRHFRDDKNGGYFLTASENKDLPVRPKEIYDGAMPSANAVALHNLIDLHRITGDPRWRDRASSLLTAFGGSVRQQPLAYTHMLDGWARYLES